ncbi:MAG: hypothetical protein ACKVW3_01675 [Phycisphaerales bacterium]
MSERPDLDAIRPETPPQAGSNDPLAQAGMKSDQAEQLKHAFEVQRLRNRGVYTSRLFWLMVVWMVAVLGIIIATGIKTPATPSGRGNDWSWWMWVLLAVVFVLTSLGAWWPVVKGTWIGRLLLQRPTRLGLCVAAVTMVCLSVIVARLAISSSPRSSADGWSLMEWVVAFELPEAVLLALIGGTTANVIGLFLVVARHLFPHAGERT